LPPVYPAKELAADPVVYDNIGWKASLVVLNLKVNGKVGETWVFSDPSHADMTAVIQSNNQANGRTTK
tara:strand:- start:1163 stop:1366 length:204 start_codon:yes stop_codon:yes gene_type:complete